MKIVWDERKRQLNLSSRNLDFADLTDEYFEAAKLLPAREGRVKAIGRLHGISLVVIFRPLGTEAISVISMRQANTKERAIL